MAKKKRLREQQEIDNREEKQGRNFCRLSSLFCARRQLVLSCGIWHETNLELHPMVMKNKRRAAREQKILVKYNGEKKQNSNHNNECHMKKLSRRLKKPIPNLSIYYKILLMLNSWKRFDCFIFGTAF